MSEASPPSLMAEIAAEINMMNIGRPRQSKDHDAYNEAQAYAIDYEYTFLPLLRSMQHTSDPETLESTSNLLQWMRDNLGSPPKDSFFSLATTCVPTSQLPALDDEYDNGKTFSATTSHRSARRPTSQRRRPAPQDRRPLAPRGGLSCRKTRTKAEVDRFDRDARRGERGARFSARATGTMLPGLSKVPPSPPTEEMEVCFFGPPSLTSSDFADAPRTQERGLRRAGERTPRSGSMRGGGACWSFPYIIDDDEEDVAMLGDVDTEPEEHDTEEQFVRESIMASYHASREPRPPQVDAGGPRPGGPEPSHDAHRQEFSSWWRNDDSDSDSDPGIVINLPLRPCPRYRRSRMR